jgi:osmoprotectant transport system substrate-binding protein
MQLLAPTPFSDTSAIAVTVAYAAQNHVHGISDLTHLTDDITLGGPPQFQQTTPGLPALDATYGFVPTGYRPMAVGDQYSALNNNSIQAAEVNTTDGQLATGDYVVLRDPRRVFGLGNVVPVASAKAMTAEGPAFADTLQRVDDALTTDTIRQLNYAVAIAGQDPGAVARQFLQTHGLLTPQAP